MERRESVSAGIDSLHPSFYLLSSFHFISLAPQIVLLFTPHYISLTFTKSNPLCEHHYMCSKLKITPPFSSILHFLSIFPTPFSLSLLSLFTPPRSLWKVTPFTLYTHFLSNSRTIKSTSNSGAKQGQKCSLKNASCYCHRYSVYSFPLLFFSSFISIFLSSFPLLASSFLFPFIAFLFKI